MGRCALAATLLIMPQALAFAAAAATAGRGAALAARARAPAQSRLRASSAAADAPEPSVIFVLGGPGAGKGTQCALLQRAFGLQHLSAGELLRAEASKPTPLGGEIAQALAEGQIVPSAVTVQLLRQAMGEARGPFLIDGFPRSLENLQAYERQCGSGTCAFILYLDLSEDAMRERILERGQTSGRSDDNLATVQKRFATFNKQTMPVLDAAEGRGLLRRVPAAGTPDEVFGAIAPLFAPFARAPALG